MSGYPNKGMSSELNGLIWRHRSKTIENEAFISRMELNIYRFQYEALCCSVVIEGEILWDLLFCSDASCITFAVLDRSSTAAHRRTPPKSLLRSANQSFVCETNASKCPKQILGRHRGFFADILGQLDGSCYTIAKQIVYLNINCLTKLETLRQIVAFIYSCEISGQLLN